MKFIQQNYIIEIPLQTEGHPLTAGLANASF